MIRSSQRLGSRMIQSKPSAFPFLKWAGGKRWFVLAHSDKFPASFERYIEPFLGSGAVFFYLAPESSIISDANPELINAYLIIREEWERLELLLEAHQNRHSEEHYYKVRAVLPKDLVERAARFLYLNRTCWNGLYRENRAGLFNVPIGTKDTVVLDEDDFARISIQLSNSEITCCDFEETVDRSNSGDLLFVDPPYTVKHNINGFIKYNQKIFSWADQVRLRDALLRARGRGVSIMMTNAHHESVMDLYRGFHQTAIGRRSTIAGDSGMRGRTEELLVTSFA